MTAIDIQTIAMCALGLTILLLSLIPECIFVTSYDFKDAPIFLKIYTVIHIGIIIAIVLYLNWVRPSNMYIGL